MPGVGPPPSPHARRRNARPYGGIVQLPANGYTGKIPRFPLGRMSERHEDERERELALWRELWRTPQAHAWAAGGEGWVREVALYARWSVQGELGSLDAQKESRQLADRLGLSPRAARGLMWEITSDELADKRSEQAVTATGDARSRAARLGISAVDPVDPDAASQ